jgi:hypothetical protein
MCLGSQQYTTITSERIANFPYSSLALSLPLPSNSKALSHIDCSLPFIRDIFLWQGRLLQDQDKRADNSHVWNWLLQNWFYKERVSTEFEEVRSWEILRGERKMHVTRSRDGDNLDFCLHQDAGWGCQPTFWRVKPQSVPALHIKHRSISLYTST